MIQAITIHTNTGVTKEFIPTGVEWEWELKLWTGSGPQPGGLWDAEDVARDVVDSIYGN